MERDQPTGARFYQRERAKVLLYDPAPAMIVLVSANSEPARIASMLRRLADDIEAGAALPAPRTV